MLTQLTLDVDETLVLRAKTYAQRSGKSLSEVVADYFARLEYEEALGICRRLPARCWAASRRATHMNLSTRSFP